MTKKVLWAPWRMEYLQPLSSKSGCIFCQLPQEVDARTALILDRRENVYTVLNKYPYNSGHLMIVPMKHQATLSDLDSATRTELMDCAAAAIEVLQRSYKPDGFNMGINQGRSAGAGIPEHLHFHVVPRWNGDTNFMPVLAETKSLPQHLMAIYDTIKEHFHKKG